MKVAEVVQEYWNEEGAKVYDEASASPFRSKRFWERTKGKLPMYSLHEYTDIFLHQGLKVTIDQEEEYGTPLAKLIYGGFKFYLIEGLKNASLGRKAKTADRTAGELASVLVCPECRIGLQKEHEKLVCENCCKDFAVRDGIPDLLPAEERLL